MTAIVVLSLAVIGGLWAWSAVSVCRARRAVAESRSEINRRATEARQFRYVADMRQAYELVQNGRTSAVLELLNKWQPAPGEPDVRNFAWRYLRRLCHDEKRTLRGHNGAVCRAEFSPDGRMLVSCGQDGTVRFWEVATGRPLRTMPARSGEVNDAAFAPDGHTLATVGDDGTIKLWNLETGSDEPEATIQAHKGDAIAACFSPDGRRLISAGRNDRLIKLWDRVTHKALASKQAHEGLLESMVLAPGGEILATVGWDGYAKLWSLADLSEKGSVHVISNEPVYGLAFSADGTRLATSDGQGHVWVWDLKTGQQIPGFQGFAHRDGPQAVRFLAKDRIVVSADDRGLVRLAHRTKATGPLPHSCDSRDSWWNRKGNWRGRPPHLIGPIRLIGPICRAGRGGRRVATPPSAEILLRSGLLSVAWKT